MRLKSVFMCLAMLAVPAAAAAPLPAPHQVEIPEGNITLHAQLYRPDGDGPFPTVIALHGCGGLAGRSEAVLPRYRDWAEQLLTSGHAVLLPDSYGSRELGPQCRTREHQVQTRRARVADINAARQWLVQQKWVAKSRISLIGWGNGAAALLWAVRPQMWSRNVEPDFRSAVAFYPDCRTSSGLGWSARVPTLVLIGARDDVTSSSACHQMVDGARGRSALARIVVYPEAYHDFDRANLPLHAVAASSDVDITEPGHIGTDASARKDAQKQVAEWLAR
ncbi:MULTISPECIES: dienelactone hydrolase family protein [unclassified Bradyrhizobium]|uniref:dienelactone hydrolase family protein n=1 Tax=unclassified Bradyrhizobium TaxID=2631580 RepID=UPI001BA80125|nr:MULTISPECIES: dienelactone hydrolase family protein [unclassified Bradyrhizobium]MBR1203174.1 dienelactone hydrolase family protein [Bradyrhizobium sp. AUGA SZCCT0124]MBR1312837.1 dienelactone hydrolase family protein [Bradyrhizobium sp. AUGA SZCCT0051]MBR1341195.1 dienelactone hydrolase family protein [Bradyrhizobium sp. AUGA SZCCT0105]MBR1356867.1 dienelactone hydrolase family protein [Bradyrhizobium sp. AUGA SZCCT0045]